MQIAKWVPMTIACALLSVPAMARGTEELKQKFLDATEIELGPVNKYAGDPECLEGDLNILQIDDGTITLMMGARSLIPGIGIAQQTTPEHARWNVTYGARTARFDSVTKLKGATYEFHIKVAVTGDHAFQYTQLNKTNGNVTVSRVCKYAFGAPEESGEPQN